MSEHQLNDIEGLVALGFAFCCPETWQRICFMVYCICCLTIKLLTQ